MPVFTASLTVTLAVSPFTLFESLKREDAKEIIDSGRPGAGPILSSLELCDLERVTQPLCASLSASLQKEYPTCLAGWVWLASPTVFGNYGSSF